MILALALAVVLAIVSAIAWRLRLDVIEAQSEAFDRTWERDEAIVKASNATDALKALLIPLGWTYEMVMDQADVHPEFVARLRVYLHAIYGDAQGGLQANDVEMAEYRDAAALMDPPRRLPRYPQVPPYLATVEDVAGVPGMIQSPVALEDAAEFARQWREADEAGGPGRSMILGDGAEHFDPHGTPIEALDARQEASTEAVLEQAARDTAMTADQVNAVVQRVEDGLSAEGDLDEWTRAGTERLARALAEHRPQTEEDVIDALRKGQADLVCQGLAPDAGEVDAVVIECDNGHRFTEVPLTDATGDETAAEVLDRAVLAGWPCPTCGHSLRVVE